MTGTWGTPAERLRRTAVETPAPITHDRLGRPIVGPCLLRARSLDGGGYSTIKVDGRARKAHRVAYAIAEGVDLADVPSTIDHLCRVRHCIARPHLEAVTQPENVLRGDTGRHNRIKTECPEGHPYDLTNTRVGKDGRRHCRTCALESGRRYEARNPYRKRTNA